jgi:hypothetical protein
MANEPEQTTTKEPQTDHDSKPSYDAIVLAAYFIALDRHARGEAPDPLKAAFPRADCIHATNKDACPFLPLNPFEHTGIAAVDPSDGTFSSNHLHG